MYHTCMICNVNVYCIFDSIQMSSFNFDALHFFSNNT